ncbi:hypothetical protein Zmor_027821 [Zophobas morio]|uniref:Uncharacterized protein n=1 Tax=Zophobas morio TaxID=2755281 RepID=A0AA38HU76_9CUCU|nr:hypothetical protein Zmor_027821 [Zophobas morio]
MNTSNVENSARDETDQRDPNVPSTLDLRHTQEVIDNETEEDITLEHQNYNEVEAEHKIQPTELKTVLAETKFCQAPAHNTKYEIRRRKLNPDELR